MKKKIMTFKSLISNIHNFDYSFDYDRTQFQLKSFNFNKRVISLISVISLLMIVPVNGHAILSTQTVNIISGTAPYFTFDDGETKLTNSDELLTIKLSNGKIYSKATNESSGNSPIELPEANQTIADISMLIPSQIAPVSQTDPTQKVDLNAVVADPYNYWKDDDDDQNATATGSLTLTITDANGNKIKRSDTLSACDGPYIVTLKSTDSSLSTPYGLPRNINYTGETATYYINPKVDGPYVCSAKPNLAYRYDESTNDGPAYMWDGKKGFKLQSLTDPTKNFPTTGAQGLFFDLTMGGALVQDISYSKNPADSGIDLAISGSGNVAKVMLTGPRNGATKEQAATAVPTTFTIYADKAQNTPIYTFKISKWFIVNREEIGGYPNGVSYCQNLGYYVPLISDYTNGNGDGGVNSDWTGGYPGQGSTFRRMIGGGLFAEWGAVTVSGTQRYYYPDSDFHNYGSYWAEPPFSKAGRQHAVYPLAGVVGSTTPNERKNKIGCVNIKPNYP